MSLNTSKESLSIPLMKTNSQTYGSMTRSPLSLPYSPQIPILIKQKITCHLNRTLPNPNRNPNNLTLLTAVKEKSVENSLKNLMTHMRNLLMHPSILREAHGSTQPIKLMGEGRDIKLS